MASLDLGLEDMTTTPYTFYQWNGSQYTVNNPTAGSVNYNQGRTGAVTADSHGEVAARLSSIKDFGAVGDGLLHGGGHGRDCRMQSRRPASRAKRSTSRPEITCWITARPGYLRGTTT